jgi:hypothetical protein
MYFPGKDTTIAGNVTEVTQVLTSTAVEEISDSIHHMVQALMRVEHGQYASTDEIYKRIEIGQKLLDEIRSTLDERKIAVDYPQQTC